LRRFVRAYAAREYSSSTAAIEPSPPHVEPVLQFEFGTGLTVCFSGGKVLTPTRVAVVGARLDLGIHLRLERGVNSFAVFLRPAGFTALFGVPMRELTNTSHDAECVLGVSVASIWEQLAEEKTFSGRVSLVEAYLLARVQDASCSRAAQSADVMLKSRGTVRVADVARWSGVGVRQFERQFAAAFGAAPKAFSRVARFQSALDLKLAAPERTWLDVAHALGYHDQMHLIHDFEHLAGASPERLLAVIGDARPPALTQRE
jgi:AraC-like DNA-binding protein